MKKFLLFALAVVFCAGSAAHLIDGTGREETDSGLNDVFFHHNFQYHKLSTNEWAFDWLVERGYFNTIIDEIDLRIDKLNALAKPLYAINCSNAFTRSEHCTELARALSELVAVDNVHHNHFCMHELLTVWRKTGHDVLARQGSRLDIVEAICTDAQTKPAGEYHKIKSDLESWIRTGRFDQLIVEGKRNRDVLSGTEYVQAFIDYRAEFRPATPTTPTF